MSTMENLLASLEIGQRTQPEKIIVRVRNLYGQWMPIEISRDATILELKVILEKEEGVPIDKQILKQKHPLKDEKELTHYGIIYGSRITMKTTLQNFISFHVLTLNGTALRVTFEPDDTFENLKEEVLKREENPSFGGVGVALHSKLEWYEVKDRGIIKMIAKDHLNISVVEEILNNTFLFDDDQMEVDESGQAAEQNEPNDWSCLLEDQLVTRVQVNVAPGLQSVVPSNEPGPSDATHGRSTLHNSVHCDTNVHLVSQRSTAPNSGIRKQIVEEIRAIRLGMESRSHHSATLGEIHEDMVAGRELDPERILHVVQNVRRYLEEAREQRMMPRQGSPRADFDDGVTYSPPHEGNDNIEENGNEEDEGAGEPEEPRGSGQNGTGGEQNGLMNPEQVLHTAEHHKKGPSNVSPEQPKAPIPKQTTFTVENLHQLLETGNILGVLEAVNESLSKLTPFPADQPGIMEILRVLSDLQIMEQTRIRGNLPIKDTPMVDGDLPNIVIREAIMFSPTTLFQTNRQPDDIVFYVRSFDKFFVVIMKQQEMIADLKRIVEEKTGMNAENLRCFIGERLLLDCYEIRQAGITEYCLVHVMEGTPNDSTCF
ncbi:unnamed protein product [Caenorhabditis brenneri]